MVAVAAIALAALALWAAAALAAAEAEAGAAPSLAQPLVARADRRRGGARAGWHRRARRSAPGARRRWTFVPSGARGSGPCSGDLAVAVDLGSFAAAALDQHPWRRPARATLAAGAAARPRGRLARAALRGIFAAAVRCHRLGRRRSALMMNAPDADAPLVERVKQGDVKAFEMLVVKYQRRIERLIGRMVRDVDLVPDIAQETFIRAYRALPQFRGEARSTPGCTASPSTPPRRPDGPQARSGGHRIGARRPRRRRRNSARRERTKRRRDARGRAGQQGNRRGGELCDRSACPKTCARRSRCARSKASATKRSPS